MAIQWSTCDRPALVAVDDDAGALLDIERELRDRYARHYQVIGLGSLPEAQARLEDLAAAGEEVVLVLAGLRLSDASGIAVLEAARRLHPHAKRGVMITWGDWVTGKPAT